MTAARVRDAVLVSGRDLDALAYAVHTARRIRRQGGAPAHPDLERLAALLDDTATSSGDTRRPQEDTTADAVGQAEHITTSEAAALLGTTRRQVTRLAPQLDGQFVGGRWLLPRDAVTEHLKGRR